MRKIYAWVLGISVIVSFLTFAPALWADDTEKININTASADELKQLKGIGEKKAAKIIEYRENHGPFEIPEDFIKVPGIGLKIYEMNKERIFVE